MTNSWVSAVAFDLDDLNKLFQVVSEPKIMIAYLIALFGGLRIGEVCSLKKSDFDFNERKICLKEGKTGPRNILIPYNEVWEIFKKWFEFTDCEYVIPTRALKQGSLVPKSLAKEMMKDLKKAGLDLPLKKDKNGKTLYKYTFHTFRHTYASVSAEFGIPPEITRLQLGHRSVRTTIDCYTHFNENKLNKEIKKVWKPQDIIQRNVSKQTIDINQDPKLTLQMKLVNGDIAQDKYEKLLALIERV